jgi:penicillin amidase
MELPKSGLFSTVFSALLRPVIHRLDRYSLPKYDGELKIGGLHHPASVRWDEYAIPSVFAADEHDLFLAQGYLHAQERLWQMELSRRFLSGRMAEIFGNFALPWKELSSQFRGRASADFDYFIRLLGIRDTAIATLGQLAEPERLRLSAYSNGVNAYIERCGKKLPWEFRLLRFEAEPWRPEDTLTIGIGLALLLSTALYTRLNLIAIADKLRNAPEKLRALLPYYPDSAATITRSVWDQTRGLWRFTNGLFAGTDWHSAGHGSNSWAVAKHRSTSGSAMLCNDPHLRMTLPSTWYLMGLRAEGDGGDQDSYEVWGASIPGMPCIQIGHNRMIAWGVTAAICDDVEIYRERLHRLEPDLYLIGHQWKKLDTRRETIKIRGGRAIEIALRQSRHGPIISDFGETAPGQEILSVRWTAHEVGQELRSLYGVNRAVNWQSFLDALSDHGAPSLNFIYADREGNIGYTLAGKIPRRAQAPTLLPLAGWDVKNDWQGYIPFAELPRLYNPPEGVVATANNRIADPAYRYYLSHLYEPPPRIRRIEQLLGAREKLSTEDLSAMQLDDLSLHAKEFIQMLRDDLTDLIRDDGIIQEAAKRLLTWDGKCSEHSVEAAIFHVFHHRLLVNLLGPDLGDELLPAYTEILNQCIVPTDRIFADAYSPWFAARPRAGLVATALREACGELEEKLGEHLESWRWGRIHQIHMNHSLGRFGILKPLLGIGPIPAPGDGMTLNLGFYRHSNPYTQTVGATLRFIVELNRRNESRFVLASGQSGHPSSPHYRDQTELWRKGRTIALSTGSSAPPSGGHLLLNPV